MGCGTSTPRQHTQVVTITNRRTNEDGTKYDSHRIVTLQSVEEQLHKSTRSGCGDASRSANRCDGR